MTVQQLVEAIDAEVLKGNITGAFEQFAADDCITWSDPDHKTTSKAQKAEILGWFFQNIARINRIERVAVRVEGDTTFSQFVFDFTNRQGENLVYQEVIRRVWKNGRLVEEQYLLNEALDVEKKKPVTKKAEKKEATAEETVPTAEPTPAPAAAAKGKATRKTTTTKKSGK